MTLSLLFPGLVHVRADYPELTDEQITAVRAISKDSVMRNGTDAWFDLKAGKSDVDVTVVCTAQKLSRVYD